MNSAVCAMITAKDCAEKNLRVSVSRCSITSSSRDLLVQNYSNFKRSSEPVRFMFYESGSWVNYPAGVADVMKQGFLDSRPMIETQFEGRDRLFDFYRMLEIRLESGSQRSISWIDVNGNCFFPKVFVECHEGDDSGNCCENCPSIDIEIKLRENSGNSESFKVMGVHKTDALLSKRKRECNVEKINSEGSSSNSYVKRRQLVRENESESARWPKTRIMGTCGKGYTVVKNLFVAGLGTMVSGAEVTVINQFVRNEPLDKARYQIFMKQMEATRQARGDSSTVFAWFGTSAKGVENILSHGFGLPGVVPSFENYGLGIHLSPVRSSQHSAMLSEIDENGEKHVILCRVILGKCEKVDAGSQQSHPSSVDYDTGVDDLRNPKWYVVWHANMNTHILPECVVSFRPANMSAAGNGTRNLISVPQASVFIAKLFSKLKTCLPMPKIQELQVLCGSYKEGKLGKNIFMQKLRSAVGDDMLRSTIREIHG